MPLALTLRNPAFLALLVPLGLVLWAVRSRKAAALPLAPLMLFAGDPLPQSVRSRLVWLPWVLTAVGIACAVVSLARPVTRTALPPTRAGIDLLLLIDASSSMTQNDLDLSRTRLAVARDAAKRFIQARPDDRIGLMTFARYPDLRCPLTLDHRALGSMLQTVQPVNAESPEDATGLGTAVARAADVLSRRESRSRVVVLFTDGEENVALAGQKNEIAPNHAAQLCERVGVRVYVIVAGEGRRDDKGAWQPLDTKAVERLALRTGGTFDRVRNAESVDDVYRRIDQLETAPLDAQRFVTADQFAPLLLLGMALVLIGQLLGSTWLAVTP